MAGTPASAVEVATRALARRELSTAELRIRLGRAGFSEDEAERAIEQLRDAGYQSDERTARERAHTLAARCVGDAAIGADLRRRGITRDMVEEILEELPPESERAARLAAKTEPGRRFADALRRKGYSEDVIAAATRSDVADGP